jgi:hypothetical protein
MGLGGLDGCTAAVGDDLVVWGQRCARADLAAVGWWVGC